MTTIAARKLPRTPLGTGWYWQIAADSQETVEGTDAGDIKLPCQKIFTVIDGSVVATAGDSAAGHMFVAYMARPNRFKASFRTDPARAFECLVRDKQGNLWLYDEDMLPQEITADFYSIGTGRMAAFAAMEQGADPRRAVEIAAKYDPYTGGDIVVAD